MSDSVLPAEFAILETYKVWCLRTETERNNRRIASSFADITTFADAVLPHVGEIVAYIDARQAEGVRVPRREGD